MHDMSRAARRRNRSSFIDFYLVASGHCPPILHPQAVTHDARSIFIDRGIDDMWQLKFFPVGRKTRNNALDIAIYIQCTLRSSDEGGDAERIRNPSCSIARHVTVEASYKDCEKSVTFSIYLFVVRYSTIFPFRGDFMLRNKREIMRIHVTLHNFKKCNTVLFYLLNPSFLSNQYFLLISYKFNICYI
jgi:hypothetical protein